ncbi:MULTISPECIES: gluconokinase [unclassified Microbacterium]|uniref:gluconokinase n=1 Tax=Microbacterium sp. JZ37 TaxID=2654193 RepID=UPI002B4662E1|nr:gluconokinase [Microbacterium sp. JZ37]WRH17885.1 carbohydrate kinase [Microbacterium sp. JZ37]
MTNPRDIVIGVDMGTTATKAVAYTVDGELVASASQGYPLEEPHPGHAVQDPELILGAVYASVREVVAEVGAERVAGLSFSSAMHSLLALDAQLQPITPVVTWADTRAAVQAERLRASASGLALHRRTGTPIHPMSPLTKLIWFREQEPRIRQQAAIWAGIKDWVLLRMCGALVIDHSLASCSGLMDIHRLDWDEEALSLAGIRAEQLPELVPTTTVLDALTEEGASATGLPLATPVVVGAGDGPLANLGVGAVRPGVAACSIGTSGALRVAVRRPAVDPRGGVFCYALTEDRWVIGGAINNGGVTLEWVRSEIAGGHELSTAELLDAAATVPAGSGGLIMLPYLLSERAPHWSSIARGAYIGLTRAHRTEHLVRAAVEGVALQLALVLQSMRAADLEVEEIRATGGVMKHPLWQQTLADAFGAPVGLLEGQEGSSYGAALLGMQALGLIESIDVAAERLPVHETIRPHPGDAAVYGALLPVFDELYDALLPTYTRLRRLAPSLPIAF